MKAVLVVSIGNSRTAVARVVAGRVGRVFRAPTDASGGRACDAQLREALGGNRVGGSIIGSAVPERTGAWRRALLRAAGAGDPLVATPDLDPGVPMSYPGRSTLGVDRLADICGGAARYGLPLIIVDLGTAVTVNVLTKKRGFVGGVILPGPDLILRALSGGTACLPRVRPDPLRGVPVPLGRNTEESLRIGAMAGCAAMIEGLVRAVRRRLRQPAIPVVVTGGGAERVNPVFDPPARRDRHLTLYGLARLFEIHRDRRD